MSQPLRLPRVGRSAVSTPGKLAQRELFDEPTLWPAWCKVTTWRRRADQDLSLPLSEQLGRLWAEWHASRVTGDTDEPSRADEPAPGIDDLDPGVLEAMHEDLLRFVLSLGAAWAETRGG